MGRVLAALGLTILVGAAASVAPAAMEAVGKKVLGGRGFATNVTVSFKAPEGYTIDSGRYENWKGPVYTYLNTGSEAESGLHFDVHSATTRSIERAARDKIGTDMGGIPTKQLEAGPILVPHLVRGRTVGVIKGFFLIREGTREDYEGWIDAALAFWLGRGYPVLAADVDTTAPSDDSNNRIRDQLPSVWNRRVVEEGIRGIAVEGNLAPRRLTARVQGRRVAGRVRDSLGHPLVRVKLTVRTPDGKPCCVAVTSATGVFTLNVPASAGSGTFRLSVAVGGARASKTVRIG